jgi:hypothetical protein
MSNTISTFRRLTASVASLESKPIATPARIEVFARIGPTTPPCTGHA